jgi:ribonuclease Z
MGSRLVEKRIGGVLLQGFSLAGEESVVVAPELNVAFDIGRAPREAVHVDHVCLSHGHMDHAAGLAYYFSQRGFQGAPPGCLLVHHQLVPAIQDLLQVWGRIEGHVAEAKIVGVDEDEDFALRRGMVIRPFRVKHRGPSLGFSVIEVRKKLKPEYAELSGRQIVALKNEGKAIENRIEVAQVAYCGDTSPGGFLDYEHVRNAEVLIIECTFFDDDHLVRARKGHHMHISDLPAVYERVANRHIVLTHFTRRTFMRDAKRMLQATLKPEDLARTAILMELPTRRKAARKPFPESEA